LGEDESLNSLLTALSYRDCDICSYLAKKRSVTMLYLDKQHQEKTLKQTEMLAIPNMKKKSKKLLHIQVLSPLQYHYNVFPQIQVQHMNNHQQQKSKQVDVFSKNFQLGY
jgi:hypothetical protein